MRPENLKTKIFLDSGDPEETRAVLSNLSFLDGQTTNPSLIAKNPATQGKKFTKKELMDFYRGVAEEISSLIPEGDVSLEVYADAKTTSDEMLEQAYEMNKWIPNARIKLPITFEGLKTAEILVKEGLRVNMTLIFSQEQALACDLATKERREGQVIISPFVGRLDDIGENGLDLVQNILKMFKTINSNVQVLAASLRSSFHIQAVLSLDTHVLTAPSKILKESLSIIKEAKSSMVNLLGNQDLKNIAYKDLNITKTWKEYDIFHELTKKGLERFASDWNGLLT